MEFSKIIEFTSNYQMPRNGGPIPTLDGVDMPNFGKNNLRFYRLNYMNENIDKKLESKNIKPTAVRLLVLQVLINQKTAISLPELELKFEKADRATLYRTLKTFEEKKLIHRIEDGTGAVKYALCHEKCSCHPEDLHVHFLCTKCNQTYCLNEIQIPDINLPPNFLLKSVNMVVKGICSNCKK